VGVRLYRFGSLPAGMHQDEVATAYDAFALLQDGVERHGHSWPVVLPSWGSGMNALPAYVQLPFQAVGGATPGAARAAQLVACLTSALGFVLLCARLRGTAFALLAAGLIAITPWHILISRWALDENLFPAIFLGGVFFEVLAVERPRLLALAAVFFGLSLYAHGAAYFVVPAYVAASAGFFLRAGHWRAVAAAAAILIVIALPIGAYLAINTLQLESVVVGPMTIPRLSGPPRFQTVALVFNAPLESLPGHVWALGRLLVTQRDWNEFNAVPGFGLIYLSSLPFVAFGVFLALTERRTRPRPELLMLVWLLAGVALAMLLTTNVNRLNVLLFPLVYFLARGIEPLRRSHVIFAAVCVLYVAQFSAFVYTYFTTYQSRIAPSFFASFDSAIHRASRAPGLVCVTNDRMNMPYVYVLFTERIDPRVFQRTVVYENPGAEFQGVQSFDRYVFGLERCPFEGASAVVARSDEPFARAMDGNVWTAESVGGGFLVARRRQSVQ
jgi:4-amino-4-deoxy-L-arabinose transferase-like glycosyltransferase